MFEFKNLAASLHIPYMSKTVAARRIGQKFAIGADRGAMPGETGPSDRGFASDTQAQAIEMCAGIGAGPPVGVSNMIGLTSSRDEASRVLAAWLRGPRAPSLAPSAPAPLVLFLCRSNTALSIMAEIVAARHGYAGGRLADAHGRIHAVDR